MANNVHIVIGSWGSYNECNERALGSSWLDLSDYSDWDEITEELAKQGFELDGIDEELFIQDIEGLPSGCAKWDYMSPQVLFETLLEADVLNDDYRYEIMSAYIEVRSWSDFKSLVDSHGYHWDDDVSLYKSMDWLDYGEEMWNCCEPKIDDRIMQFFDFEAYGRYMGDYYAEEYSGGIIEIRS